MRSELLDLDLVDQAFDIVFYRTEESNRNIYLLAFLKYCIFDEDGIDKYMRHVSAAEEGEEAPYFDGAEPLVLTIRPDGATIVFDMDGYEFPPRRYTLQEIRDALEDWRDYLRERAREKKSQGA